EEDALELPISLHHGQGAPREDARSAPDEPLSEHRILQERVGHFGGYGDPPGLAATSGAVAARVALSFGVDDREIRLAPGHGRPTLAEVGAEAPSLRAAPDPSDSRSPPGVGRSGGHFLQRRGRSPVAGEPPCTVRPPQPARPSRTSPRRVAPQRRVRTPELPRPPASPALRAPGVVSPSAWRLWSASQERPATRVEREAPRDP